MSVQRRETREEDGERTIFVAVITVILKKMEYEEENKFFLFDYSIPFVGQALVGMV